MEGAKTGQILPKKEMGRIAEPKILTKKPSHAADKPNRMAMGMFVSTFQVRLENVGSYL
jgi:hypothetical protein